MKKFNTEGVCIDKMHYMVDTSRKIKKIVSMIDGGAYFTINRGRQYGKTTTINKLENVLRDEYLVISTSFEELGDKAFENENEFCESFINLVAKELEYNNVQKEIRDAWEENKSDLEKLEELSEKITILSKNSDKKILLMIDEVDKSSNNQLFLHFLGMLRNKYLERNKSKGFTFHSVILAGVHDVKNLKLRLRPEDEKKYNSPWNIAADFKVDMSFSPDEIATMLVDYEVEHPININIEEISNEIYFYTSGYPYLVSKICKEIAEEDGEWSKAGVTHAVRTILKGNNTLFDSIIKNVENDLDIKETIYSILIEGAELSYVKSDTITSKAEMHGIVKESEYGKVQISNKIFEILLYNHMAIKKERESLKTKKYERTSQFITKNGDLDIIKALDKFQELMREEYRDRTEEFVEKEGRLIFLAFIKPIINGTGFYFVETETRTNRRMDIVITYNSKQYIIELKKWYGKEYEENGYDQISDYLDIRRETTGYMVMFDFRKDKKYTKKWIDKEKKRIYEIVV